MATTQLDTLKAAVLANDDLNGRRMLELARDKDGALKLAQMCDGYDDMGGREKIKMLVTASIILKLFLEQHRTQERNAANTRKRKADEEPQAEDEPEDEPEGEPEDEPEDGEVLEPDPDDEPQPEPPGSSSARSVAELATAPRIDPRNGSGL